MHMLDTSEQQLMGRLRQYDKHQAKAYVINSPMQPSDSISAVQAISNLQSPKTTEVQNCQKLKQIFMTKNKITVFYNESQATAKLHKAKQLMP